MFRVPFLGAQHVEPPGAFRLTAQVHQGSGTIASERQNFVSSRLQEDFVLIQRVAHSRTRDQVWAAYAGFWQKAVADYGKEYMTAGRLVAGVTSRSVAAAQFAAEELSAGVFRASRIG
jgi:hypothetical protein